MIKLKISYNDKADTVDSALSIPLERAEDLEYRMQLILHDFLRPTKTGFLPSTGQILKLYVGLAENTQEVVFCAYMAGMKVEELFGDVLADEIDEEDEP